MRKRICPVGVAKYFFYEFTSVQNKNNVSERDLLVGISPVNCPLVSSLQSDIFHGGKKRINHQRQ